MVTSSQLGLLQAFYSQEERLGLAASQLEYTVDEPSEEAYQLWVVLLRFFWTLQEVRYTVLQWSALLNVQRTETTSSQVGVADLWCSCNRV